MTYSTTEPSAISKCYSNKRTHLARTDGIRTAQPMRQILWGTLTTQQAHTTIEIWRTTATVQSTITIKTTITIGMKMLADNGALWHRTCTPAPHPIDPRRLLWSRQRQFQSDHNPNRRSRLRCALANGHHHRTLTFRRPFQFEMSISPEN